MTPELEKIMNELAEKYEKEAKQSMGWEHARLDFEEGFQSGVTEANKNTAAMVLENIKDAAVIAHECDGLEKKLAIAVEAFKGMCEDYYDLPSEKRIKYLKPSSHIAREALRRIEEK